MLVTTPEPLRARYRNLGTAALVKTLAQTRPTWPTDSPIGAAAQALRTLARTHQEAHQRANQLEEQMGEILTEHYPAMLAIYGAGPIVAAQLVVTAGGNPNRIRNEAAFASLCGVAPIPASSGKTARHRLNRGGDRRGNQALHRIALIRMRHDQRTRDYVERRTADGKTKREIMRCLKRAIAREVYRALTNPSSLDQTLTNSSCAGNDFQVLRRSLGLTQTYVAKALHTYPARIPDIENHRRPLPALTQQYATWIKTLDTQ